MKTVRKTTGYLLAAMMLFLLTSCAIVNLEVGESANKINVDILNWQGTQQLGTSGDDVGYSITTDAAGNIFITGSTGGALEGQAYNGGTDIFLVKYDAGGNKQWSKQLGTSETDVGYDITVDAAGNIFITGVTGASLNSQTHTTGQDIFLVKYDASGDLKWTKQLGASNSDVGYGVTTDTAGNIFITGVTGADLNGQTYNGSVSEIFLIKYDPSGNEQWTKLLGGLGGATYTGLDVTTDALGNVYVTGGAGGSLNGEQFSNGQLDMFLTKYDPSGNEQWTKLLGAAGIVMGLGVTTDTAGNIYVAGLTNVSLNSQTHIGGDDMFLVKYDPSGNEQWTKLLGTSENDVGYDITADAAGNIYVAGDTKAALDGQAHNGASDIFIVKYDTSGYKQWTKQLGTIADDAGWSMTADSGGNLYVTGGTGAALDWQTHHGGSDIFIVKYDPTGDKK